MKTKIKTYILTVSRYFPSNHPKIGQETGFVEKILSALVEAPDWSKIHTIRSNYELWAKRIREVQQGTAILSLRYWEGKPYRSKQIEFAKLDKDSGIGIQAIILPKFLEYQKCECRVLVCDYYSESLSVVVIGDLSKNDGLRLEDFKAWFKGYDLSQMMAIIHFTKYRYTDTKQQNNG